jgi:3-dehydroquinate synthase
MKWLAKSSRSPDRLIDDFMQTVKVDLGQRSYNVFVGEGILSAAGDLLKGTGIKGKVAVVTNPTVAQLYLDPVHDALQSSGFEVTPVLIPDGEEYKNLSTLSTIFDRLISERFERKSAVVALGGGVVGDVAGFAAATYLRGTPLVQIPTTLLAQVDSSVGGKTGVNHPQGKNLIGAFYQPRAVIIDVALLSSLPRRELIAGTAEIIKYGIIEDPAFFGQLEEQLNRVLALDRRVLTQVIATSCAIKARVIEKDEREDDHRAVLNFGHTVGHALEAATHYQRFLHGEAVGIGMAKAAAIAYQQGFCDTTTLGRIIKLIKAAGLPTEIPEEVSTQSLIQGMEVDKKSADGKIKFVICTGIGKTCFQSLTAEQIAAALGT